MRVYFDSSALAKRYVHETGSADVLHWCEEASVLALSVIAVPELISAFNRLLREGRIDVQQYRDVKTDLLADIEDALVCDTAPEVVGHAIRALESHPLRGVDALHIGAALACEADVFVSADQRQCSAARTLGLRAVSV
ncbi:MAG: type II toxin-antitoxin system VapC family toxin [Burkholderiaceae bacterium]|nr:type II toxin-antitoxin system VapC family toxin [Burkholderiaceae bacterium]